MPAEDDNRLTPEEKELNKKLTELEHLKERLADRERQLTKFRSELIEFEDRYIRLIGEKSSTHKDVKAIIAELIADSNPEDSATREKAEKARAAAGESVRYSGAIYGVAKKHSERIKKLHREIAKLVHPDLAVDDKDLEFRNLTMADVNKAYEDNDEIGLASVFIELSSRAGTGQDKKLGLELVQTIRKIASVEERYEEIEKEIKQLSESELFELKRSQDDSERAGRDMIKEMAAELDGSVAAAWHDLGVELFSRGDYERVIEAFDKALDVDPNHTGALYGKGVALAGVGRYEEAIGVYNRLLDIKPRHPDAWNDKGATLSVVGRHPEAIEAFDISIDINPENEASWFGKGFSLDALGRHEEAVAAYDKTLEINPRHPGAWFNKGIAYGKLGRIEEEVRCYDETLKVNQEDMDAIRSREAAMKKLGNYKDAV